MLKTTNVDGALLRRREVAPTHTEVRRRAYHPTAESKRVVAEDGLGRTIVVLGGDAGDERFDVDLRRARFFTRSVGTLVQRASRFSRIDLMSSYEPMTVLAKWVY